MMGGELEDIAAEASGTLELNEVAEAEAEGDLLAGRLQNQGRMDMMRAIRAMSRASAALTESSLDWRFARANRAGQPHARVCAVALHPARADAT